MNLTCWTLSRAQTASSYPKKRSSTNMPLRLTILATKAKRSTNSNMFNIARVVDRKRSSVHTKRQPAKEFSTSLCNARTSSLPGRNFTFRSFQRWILPRMRRHQTSCSVTVFTPNLPLLPLVHLLFGTLDESFKRSNWFFS